MSLLRLILHEDVPNLGNAGESVSVKPGYARNYLLPQGKAVLATEAKVKQYEHQNRVIAEKLAKEQKDLEALAARLRSVSLEVRAQAGGEGKLFGSVTAQQIAELLAEQGFSIDRRKIGLAEPIKSVGEHDVAIKLRGDLSANVKVVVSAS
ncbi:MAG: 50S ribosomal protein L9 [Myxococcota bacterium]